MEAIKDNALRFRPSVIIGELAAYYSEGNCTRDVKLCGKGMPAPLGSGPLKQELTKQEARERLAGVAEVALTMADTIDDWWERE